ncbi:MAG: SPOR domain-containing protein [Salinibacter sp.]
MSDSIHALLADELDISDQKAEKLLLAMLREVRKRAQQGGVRLPDLGKFRVEDGELTFSPADSLARAVNHRFEGLQSEQLRGAPDLNPDEDTDPEGPSTITLGYQDSSGWTPPGDASGESEAQESETDDEEADTEEFEIPEHDIASEAAGQDTAASSPAESASPDPSDPEDTESSGGAEESTERPDTEELYPLVDEITEASAEDEVSSAPAGSASTDVDQSEAAAETESSDEDRDDLSEIWDPGADEENMDGPSRNDEASPADAPTADSEEASFSDEDREAEAATASSDPEPSHTSDEHAAGGSSLLPRVLVTILVLVLLGGGAWYILGQRGVMPPPRQALSPTSDSSTAASPTQQAAGPPGPSATGTSEQDASSSTETSGAGSDSAATAPAPPRAEGIDPDAGGWTIVVASRADRAAAAPLVDTYRQRFSDSTLPVDVLRGTVNNTPRYRVGLGQFRTRSEAEAFLDDNSDALPSGAWPLALE